jgi:hypothetical protein
VLRLNGRDIPFINNVTYLGVTFDRRKPWRLHIEKTVAKALHTNLRSYSLFKSERSSTNIKLTLYNALIKSVMTYACPILEYAADTQLSKLQRLQNRVLRATGNLERRTLVREMHVAFKIPYISHYIIKLCRTQAEVILTHVNQNVRCIGQGDAMHRKYRKLKLGSGQAYDRSADELSFGVVKLAKAQLVAQACTDRHSIVHMLQKIVQ